MTDTHRWIVDRHEGQRSVVEVDGQGFFDLPRWLLPVEAHGDDVLAVTVEADRHRAIITVVRDADATSRAKAEARAAIKRLAQRDPGGDIEL